MKSRLHDTGVVEFFGLPGSGKTTAANALLGSGWVRSGPQSRRVVGLSGEGRLSRSLFKGLLIVRHPTVSARVLRESLRFWRNVDCGRRRQFLMSVLNMMYVASLLRSGRAERPLVLDQGFFQGYWAMLRALKPACRQELKIEPLFGVSFAAFASDEVQLVHVLCDGHEARRRTQVRAGVPDAPGAAAGAGIEQDEACMLLVRDFAAQLLAAGAIGTMQNRDDVLPQATLRTLHRDAR